MKLAIPEEALEQHIAVLGKTGAGKSYTMCGIVEHLLGRKQRVCVVDPKGEWYGLKVGKDGKSAGFPVIAFGDFKNSEASDVPINASSGKHVAELVAGGNRPCVIGFRGWMPQDRTRFWIDFASTLFNLNHEKLYLVIDEVHNFAMQGKVMDPDAGKCLHWTNRIASEGRGIGIRLIMASQRPQKVHKDTLTCAETLIAMRVIHPLDRGAIKDWIDGCGDPKEGVKVLAELASMPSGEGYVWSPEIAFLERLKFPRITTYDSFSAPEHSEVISKSSWADVNLEAVKEKLAKVIEEQKANDPQELKKQLAVMRRELDDVKRKGQKVAAAPANVKREGIKLTDTQKKQLNALVKGLDQSSSMFNALAGRVEGLHGELQVFRREISKIIAPTNTGGISPVGRATSERSLTVRPSLPARSFTGYQHLAKAVTPVTNGDVKIGRCERAILTVLAQHPQGRTRNQVAILSTYSVKSSGFDNALSTLRTAGFITRDNPMRITAEGMTAVGEVDPLPTGEDLRRHWLGKLGKCEAAILSVLMSAWPEGLIKEDIATQSGYSAQSSGFDNALSTLRTLELITRTNPITATPDLFQ